jgi:DNA-binding MarR family transcriptional regulator
VDRLEARGLVERRNEAGDRRVRLLALTPAGEQAGYRVWRTVARGAPTRGLPAERRAELRELLAEALGPGPEVPGPEVVGGCGDE